MTTKEEVQDHIKRARYCDLAERYQDMAAEIKKILQICHEENQEMTVQIRNLFSLAYKNLVSTRRSSWRVLSAEKQKLEEKQLADLHIVDELLARVERELLGCCDEVLEIIDQYSLPALGPKSASQRVFFLKMKGDYFRYKAEVLSEGREEEAAKMAQTCYAEAKEAAKDLKSTDPIRLGLYLNYSVFNYEILNDTKAACEIAENAFADAIADLDSLSEDFYKDSTLIMQLLRDNLTLWSSEIDSAQLKTDENPAKVA